MKQVVIEYPEGLPGLLKLSEAQFAAEVRFLAAAKLFEMGKLSSGKAAEMAGIGRVEFLHKLGTYGFTPSISMTSRSILNSRLPLSLPQ